MRFGLYAFVSFLILSPLITAAQSFGDLTGDTSSFSVSVNPQYPDPYGIATLSFLSPTINLANATMAVVAGGKQVYKGSVQPVSLQLGKAGSATNASVTISSDGVDYKQEISIQPQDVALVAEPISSSPPLYQGKSSVPIEGNVRVVAVANLRSAAGAAQSPNSLSYVWTVDGMEIANASGIGKSAILVASPLQYRSREVSVSVTNSNGSLVGGANISLSAYEPSVRIYANDSLLGIRFERAISDNYAINGAEASLYAAPFSFPTTNGAPLLQWFLNGALAQTGDLITLRPTGDGEGTASLSFVASSEEFARAATNISISFGSAKKFNIFGL